MERKKKLHVLWLKQLRDILPVWSGPKNVPECDSQKPKKQTGRMQSTRVNDKNEKLPQVIVARSHAKCLKNCLRRRAREQNKGKCTGQRKRTTKTSVFLRKFSKFGQFSDKERTTDRGKNMSPIYCFPLPNCLIRGGPTRSTTIRHPTV